MTNEEYIKKRDEIVEGFIDDVTGAHEEAAQAIDALVLEVIGEDEVEDIDLSKSAKSRWGVRARNRVRADMRRIVQGDKS